MAHVNKCKLDVLAKATRLAVVWQPSGKAVMHVVRARDGVRGLFYRVYRQQPTAAGTQRRLTNLPFKNL